MTTISASSVMLQPAFTFFLYSHVLFCFAKKEPKKAIRKRCTARFRKELRLNFYRTLMKNICSLICLQPAGFFFLQHSHTLYQTACYFLHGLKTIEVITINLI